MFHVKHQYVALNVSYETLQTADKAPETRLNNQPNYASSFSKRGAGLLWRPLHFNAEAPAEPVGETVATRSVDGGVLKML